MIVWKKAGENVVDVFTGKGWTGWSRFEVSRPKGRLMLKLVKGSPMSKEDFSTLYGELSS